MNVWILIGLFVIAGFFLIAEHRAHLVGALQYVLLAAFVLMHLFMHRHHGADNDHRHPNGLNKEEQKL